MQVSVDKSRFHKVVTVASILVIILMIVLGYLFFIKGFNPITQEEDPFANCSMDPDKKYYGQPNEARAPSPGNIWIEYHLQPIVMGFEEEDGIQYLIGALPDENYNCVRVKFIASGDIPVESTSTLLDFENIKWGIESDRVDFDTLKSRLTIGEQVNVRYLAVAPELSELNDEFCSKYTPVSERLCTLQKIHQEYLGYDKPEQIGAINISKYPVLFGSMYDLNIVATGNAAPTDTE